MIRFKILFFFSLFCYFGTSSFLFGQKQASIENMPLRWANFSRVETSMNSHVQAMTVAQINLSYETEEDNEKTIVNIALSLDHDERKSWVSKGFLRRKKDPETLDLLNHEKIHLAINYIGLKQVYDSLNARNFTLDYKSEIAGVFNRLNFLTEMRQIQYDNETRHSIKQENQLSWHKNINKELSRHFAHIDEMKNKYTIRKIIYK